MLRPSWIALLLLILSACSSTRTARNGFEKELAMASAETIFEATVYELQNDPVGASLAKKLRAKDVLSKLEVKPGIELADLYAGTEQGIAGQTPLSAEEQAALRKALQSAKLYLGLPEGPMIREVNHRSDAVAALALPADTTEIVDWSAEVRKTDVSKAQWNGIDEYVRTRLGPLTVALKELGDHDVLLISNLSLDEILIRHPGVATTEELILPISSYEKKIHWLTLKSGGRMLVISEIKGEVLLRHLQMMLKRSLGRGQPRVIVEEAKSKNEFLYSSLPSFWKTHAAKLGKIKAVMFGYANRFKSGWLKYFKGSVGDGSVDWSADIYQFSHQRVAVLQTRYPMHGEILAKSFGRLMKKIPGIRYFFSAGSGGSLILGPPNRITYPGFLTSESGAAVPNVLSPAYHRVLHRSVISPVEENQEFLSDLAKEGVGSVDMEFGHLPEEIPPSAQVGIGITVTDFPFHSQMIQGVSLTSKNTAVLREGIDQFVRAVFSFLESGKKARISRAETLLGSPFDELSRKNITALQRELGSLSSEERELLKRFSVELNPGFYVRVTEGRAERISTDGVFLSAGTVASIKNIPIHPTTPPVEDQLYGAYDQVFGGIGFNFGRERYGSVILKVRPDAWSRKSWGSEYSAFRVYDQELKRSGKGAESNAVIQNATELKKVRDAFSRIVFVPDDYREAMNLRTLLDLRRLGPKVVQRFTNSKHGEELIALMNEYDLGYLEGKIEYSMNLEDVEEVMVPKGATKLRDSFQNRGVKCSEY